MRTQLDETLDQLHQQLASIEELAPEERSKLQAAVDEIQESLDSSDVDSKSLADRLADATSQFSEAHPALANSVGRVADMLAQMGI
ncbi:protein of unknown function [Neorhodopirellula lusitana]|uniref:DUF4404 domain-containing protein n=1 Tax=Neorhodopirellula lusitana TaxID=445327 RepID=A0ABY1PZU3_9BACT|nr:DUF4404 family protein [Neorhodopirellula lusitana]SMP53183.1 protein of unknown function [Neorhodopirellula lusitana]